MNLFFIVRSHFKTKNSILCTCAIANNLIDHHRKESFDGQETNQETLEAHG
jgi:hypothetical protein